MYKRIMIVVDEGAVAKSALTEGVALARSDSAEVLFFHVLPSYVMPVADAPALVYLSPEQHQKEVDRLARRILASAATEARKAGVVSQGVVGTDADAANCIAVAAGQRDCDLVVIGSHGRNAMQRLIFGSVVTRLIPLATVPVLVCKPPARRARSSRGAEAAPVTDAD